MIAVRLGRHAAEALAPALEDSGLTLTDREPGWQVMEQEYEGTPEAWRVLLVAARDRARGRAGGWDQPGAWTTACKALAKRIEEALR